MQQQVDGDARIQQLSSAYDFLPAAGQEPAPIGRRWRCGCGPASDGRADRPRRGSCGGGGEWVAYPRGPFGTLRFLERLCSTYWPSQRGILFNVGLGEIVMIILVCLILFDPERLPEIARQAGRFLGRLGLSTQGALDQLKDETDMKDLNLPDLRIGLLRAQARD
jgi:Sec-independent protein translocase protein TatA